MTRFIVVTGVPGTPMSQCVPFAVVLLRLPVCSSLRATFRVALLTLSVCTAVQLEVAAAFISPLELPS